MATTSTLPPLATAPAQGSIQSAGAGITGGYTGHSLTLQIFIALFTGLALYNTLELLLLIFITFQKYTGVYFWSLLIGSIGIIPYSLGFLLKFFNIGNKWLDVFLLTIGWYPMVTCQSLILWSRLHVMMNDQRVIRFILYMIIVDAIVLFIPTTVLTYGSNSEAPDNFIRGYNIMEKIQMTGFCLQEFFISYLYVREALRLLSTSLQERTRKIMLQLFAINVIIVLLDVALLVVEYRNLYIIETTLKGVVYSIKMKLEFAVLGKLVQFVTPESQSATLLTKKGSNELDGNFLSPFRRNSQHTFATRGSIETTQPPPARRLTFEEKLDADLAKFRHGDGDMTLTHEGRPSPSG